MQQTFQTTVAQAIAQSLQNNNTIESMPITQPDYNSQALNTTNNHAQVHNTNGTNNTSIISPNNLKKEELEWKRTTLQMILISMVQPQHQQKQIVI